jgi:hypothetical protein
MDSRSDPPEVTNEDCGQFAGLYERMRLAGLREKRPFWFTQAQRLVRQALEAV